MLNGWRSEAQSWKKTRQRKKAYLKPSYKEYNDKIRLFNLDLRHSDHKSKKSNCTKKVTVERDILILPKKGDRKMMQLIRITSKTPRRTKSNQLR